MVDDEFASLLLGKGRAPIADVAMETGAVISFFGRATMASALVSAIAGCAPQTPAEDVASDLPRIVSLNPCLDAILVEVAEPEQILALSHYSADPAASSIPQDIARRYDVTGGTVEEVIALEPDIVLASTFKWLSGSVIRAHPTKQ